MASEIKAVVGLGNPGPKFEKTRHNIGFMVLDELAHQHSALWQEVDICRAPAGALQISIVHDELEKPFGKLQVRSGGSARGHNGLRSFIECSGSNAFFQLRFGIGRPEHRSDVGDYVLSNFNESEQDMIDQIQHAINLILQAL